MNIGPLLLQTSEVRVHNDVSFISRTQISNTRSFQAPRRTVATPPPVVQAELIADDLQQLMTVYADLRREIQFQSREIYDMRTETRRLNSQVSRMYADSNWRIPSPMRLASYVPS